MNCLMSRISLGCREDPSEHEDAYSDEKGILAIVESLEGSTDFLHL